MSADAGERMKTVLGTGIYHGIFLAHGIDVDGTIARVFNTMFDTFYALIPPERQYIFPIFWIKVLVYLLIVVLPTIKILLEVKRMGRTGILLFASGIAIGAIIVLFI